MVVSCDKRKSVFPERSSAQIFQTGKTENEMAGADIGDGKRSCI